MIDLGPFLLVLLAFEVFVLTMVGLIGYVILKTVSTGMKALKRRQKPSRVLKTMATTPCTQIS